MVPADADHGQHGARILGAPQVVQHDAGKPDRDVSSVAFDLRAVDLNCLVLVKPDVVFGHRSASLSGGAVNSAG